MVCGNYNIAHSLRDAFFVVFSDAVAFYIDRGTGPIILDDVHCTGNETKLFNWSHNNLGNHNCGPYDAGVICPEGIN